MRWFLSVALVLGGFSLRAADTHPVQVKAVELEKWVGFLAGDDMMGRANGSEHIQRAADWLAERFGEMGLQPAPGQKTFFQAYEIERNGAAVSARNVVGYLPGEDPTRRQEYIVLSAHYDHVGFNPELKGDQIFNGADDDASGVAAIMGIAATLTRLQKTAKPGLKRSLLVIAFSGEEWGLRGSKHYCKNPLLPLSQMVVNLNFELVGHSEKNGRNKFFMTGAAYSDLRPRIDKWSAGYQWQFIENPFPQMKLFFRSDNTSFALLEFDREARTATGIPAHSFSTWGGEPHYHQVTDEPDRIDYENMEGFVHMMSGVVLSLGNGDAGVDWLENEDIRFSRPE